MHCVFYPNEENKHGDIYAVISNSIGNNKYPTKQIGDLLFL